MSKNENKGPNTRYSHFVTSSLLSITTMLLHIFVVPVFYLGFILIFESQWMLRFLDTGMGYVINTLIITCIFIAVMLVSRIPMTVYRNKMRLSWWQYSIWSFTEVVIFSCFAALYMALVYGTYGYFPALGQCLILSFSILPFPYIVIAILFALIRPDEAAEAEDI